MEPCRMSQAMTLYVDLTLDKPRRFQFTPFDCAAVCRMLNAMGYRVSEQTLDADKLRILLIGRNFDAYAAVLSAGLRHEDERVTHDRAMRLLSDYLGKGGDLEVIAKAIRDAAILSGVWLAPEDRGADQGNPTNGSSGA
jgi:hypothetical protein